MDNILEIKDLIVRYETELQLDLLERLVQERQRWRKLFCG